MKKRIWFISVLLVVALVSCKKGPKVISANSGSESREINSDIFSEEGTASDDFMNSEPSSSSFTDNLHKVVAIEALPTEKYVYVRVAEANKQFWIAAARQSIDLGKVYYYRNGLLKTNFESKEYNRVFDTIYLVSSLVSHNHGAGSVKADFSEGTNADRSQKKDIPTHTEEQIEHKGSIKIADLVANAEQYEGKTVQVTGRCVKINPGIMNRNWIHLQDGSKDDYDLVVTSNIFVAEGQLVTMRALVSLNRDFGAGYTYEMILENGVLIEGN